MGATSVSVRKGYLDAPTGQVHYRTAGEGTPLLLLHQCAGSSQQFLPVYPLLAEAGFKVIAPDTPGYGMSDPPKATPTITTYAENLPAILDHFGIDKAAVLGHHTGASIACEFAALHPERVTKLILNGPPFYSPRLRDKMLARWRTHELEINEDGSHLLEPWKRRLDVSIGWTDLRAMTRHVIDMLTVRDREWVGFIAAFNYDMAARLKDMQVPTMLLTNTGEDLYICTQKAREFRPDFTYVELEGGTHDIVDEQPENWTKAVAGFVRS